MSAAYSIGAKVLENIVAMPFVALPNFAKCITGNQS